MRIFLILYFVLTFIGPLIILLSGKIDFKADYRTANRESAGISPDPIKVPEAVIQVYSARTFNWRGMFAVHTWLAVKGKNEKKYTVSQVIGWRLYQHLPPLLISEDIPDRLWFNQKPDIILDIRGERAEKLIPLIASASKNYPYPNDYGYWPGPNSNTFTAHIARQVPELQLALPSNAVGKDYWPYPPFLTRAPSGTGYQFSIYGVFGLMIARKEGIELNILGLVYGVSPSMRILKLPGFGDIKL